MDGNGGKGALKNFMFKCTTLIDLHNLHKQVDRRQRPHLRRRRRQRHRRGGHGQQGPDRLLR